MIDFLLTICCATLTQLTPTPLTLHGVTELSIDFSISALTGEATIQLQVPSLAPPGVSVRDVPERVAREISIGQVRAVLKRSGKGRDLEFLYQGHYVQAREGVRLLLESRVSVPTNVAFNALVIYTDKPMKDVTVFWRNAGNL